MIIDNKRNMYIDVFKGLLMTLVVIGHLAIFDYNSRTLILIYSFHMPAFLIIGGILTNIKNTDTAYNIIKKRFISCIIPYIIFNIISFIFLSHNVNRIECIKTIIQGVGKPDYAVNLPTWFLTFYFMIMTLYDLFRLFSIKTSKDKKTTEIKIICLVIICVTIGRLTHRFFRKVMWPPFNIQQALFCMPFVYIGDKISEYVDNIKDKIKEISKNKNKIIYTMILLFISLIIIIYIWYTLSLKNGRIDMNARDYKNQILFFINALLGFTWFSFFIYMICKIPFINKISAYIGKESLYILGYHLISYVFIYTFIDRMIPLPVLQAIRDTKILYTIYYTALEISLSLLFGYIHKKIYTILTHKK